MLSLIYCGDGNPTLATIAIEEGWLYGFRSDKRPGAHCVAFVDVNFKRPNFERHLEMVAHYHPKYATIPDLSEQEVSQSDVARALEQAERLQPHCETVFIVPKLSGQIAMLPPDVAIGYSVPSGYGGAQYPLWELEGRRVHLLGGSPRKQIQVYLHLSAIAEVISMDGNYAHGQAVKYAMFWQRHTWHYHPLVERKAPNLYQECWRWSCQNIRAYWQQIANTA